MYGTRAAASSWAKEYGSKLKEWGFKRGKSTPCVFEHEERDLKIMVHGDDFVTLGLEEQIKWFHESMQSTYEVTIRGVLGPEAKDDRRIEILNRVVEWRSNGTTDDGGPRHA